MNNTVLLYFDHPINPFRGGTERASDILAHQLKLKGMKVYYCARYHKEGVSDIDMLFLPDEKNLLSSANISFLEEEVARKQIDIIINQASNGEDIYLFNHRTLKISAKIISVLHFSVYEGLNYFEELQLIEFRWSNPGNWLTNLIRIARRSHNRDKALEGKYKRFSFIYAYSDAVVTLSDAYIRDYKEIARLPETDKLYAIGNPLTYTRTELCPKQNRLLFVGRLSFPDKRLDRLLRIWEQLYKKYPDWQLDIVGDGHDRQRLERLSRKLKLERVEFYGNQNPKMFYERSKIFCMTSTHEGLPMVILEAMQHHVIPFAFSSFGAASDIISSGVNGYLIPPFDITEYAMQLGKLMENPTLLKQTANRTCIGLSRFKSENICNQWLHLFGQL